MLYAVLMFSVFAGIYAMLYYFNSMAPIPEGAELVSDGCSGCSISTCEVHPSKRIKEVN